MLAPAHAQARPANIAAEVGIGPIANPAEGERRAYAVILVEVDNKPIHRDEQGGPIRLALHGDDIK